MTKENRLRDEFEKNLLFTDKWIHRSCWSDNTIEVERIWNWIQENYIEKKEVEKMVEEKDEIINSLKDFVESFKQRAWDAWKPMQVFRSDGQVEVDEIKKELLDSINEEAEELLSLLQPNKE